MQGATLVARVSNVPTARKFSGSLTTLRPPPARAIIVGPIVSLSAVIERPEVPVFAAGNLKIQGRAGGGNIQWDGDATTAHGDVTSCRHLCTPRRRMLSLVRKNTRRGCAGNTSPGAGAQGGRITLRACSKPQTSQRLQSLIMRFPTRHCFCETLVGFASPLRSHCVV